MKVPPREPQHNKNNHKQEPQKRTWIKKKNQYSNEECIAMKNAHSLYKIRRRNVVGMLMMAIQNT
jgi:hypothetical protein